MNNVAHRNYIQLACNWGACKAGVNIYMYNVHLYYVCKSATLLAFYAYVSAAIPATCTV